MDFEKELIRKNIEREFEAKQIIIENEFKAKHEKFTKQYSD
jgi:hypothetical protein